MASKNRSSFRMSALPVTVFAHLVAIAVITLVLVWLLHFQGGLAFKSDIKTKIFNIHPLLMVIGFILISGEAIMSYKTFPVSRNTQKFIHLILHFIALLAGIVGIYAVFKFHHELRIPDMIGTSTVCLFAIQWIFGFFSFWWPGAETGARARLAPWHIFFGIVIFFMVILSATTGLVEKFVFLSLQRSQEALIVNFTGLLILIFAITVGLSAILP